MLQTLNILENFDLKSMGYNSTRYVHTVYQAMNLAYADRDFYYGDTTQPPEEPVAGLLSKDYAKARAKLVNAERNDAAVSPGDPYPFQGGRNPYLDGFHIAYDNWHSTHSAENTALSQDIFRRLKAWRSSGSFPGGGPAGCSSGCVVRFCMASIPSGRSSCHRQVTITLPCIQPLVAMEPPMPLGSPPQGVKQRQV